MYQQQLSKMLLMYNLEKREKKYIYIYFSIAFSMWFQHHHTHKKQRK